MPTHPSSTEPPRELPSERGVAQYQRLASLLRHRIASGVYGLGDQLPSITQLAVELRVAVVTVRRAYELLGEEGLLHSQRGKGTHVAAVPEGVSGGIEQAINDPDVLPGEVAFDVLEVRQAAPLPAELRGPAGDAETCVCVRKVHSFGGEPFCYAEIYLPKDVHDRLPRDVARKKKLLSAVLQLLGDRCDRIRQRATVCPADFPLCEVLKVPFASPVARMSRRLIDADGRVLYGGITWYRGDRYVTEVDLSASSLRRMPGITEPKARVTPDERSTTRR